MSVVSGQGRNLALTMVPLTISRQFWRLAAFLSEDRLAMKHALFVGPLSFWNRFHLYFAGVLFLAFETGLIVVLLAAKKRARRDHKLLQRRFAIETVIARCSARLSACPAIRVDAEIQEGLRAITISEKIDSASWSVIDSKSQAHVYSAHGSAESLLYESEDLPWVTERLRRDEPVVLRSLTELPEKAQVDKQHLAGKSIKAAVFIPCGSGTDVHGVLVLARTVNELSWPAALVDRLCVLGNVFANAFMRKQAQQAEEQSEERFRYLFEEAPIGIAIEDIDGKILFANPALCSILGYQVDEIVGMNCCQFSDPDAAPEDSDWGLFQELRAGVTNTYRIEKRYMRKEGGRIWGRVNVTLLRGASESKPIVVATVEDITAAKQSAADLNDLNSELRQLTARLIQSQEVERQRIARELHDDISQRLALLMMDIDAWQGEIPFERASDHSTLRQIMAQLDELSTDVHNLSHRLHSTKLQHLGLPVALQELCQQLSTRHSIPIELDAENVPHALPELVSLCFYRVAQEALKNAVKHSGSSRIRVKVIDSEQILRMYIQDFGNGFDAAAPVAGLGLMTMQERLRMIGGTLRINSILASGTEVIAEAHLERSSMAARVA